MATKSVPEGYHAVTPYLMVKGAARALEFYRQIFGATEITRLESPGGGIAHAEIRIGDSIVMLADEHTETGFRGPDPVAGTPVGLHVYVDDVDACFARAIAAGSTERKPVQDQFYGDRSGTVTDPFGHLWTIATHVEDVSPEEMQRRVEAMTRKQAAV